jgi:ABC-type transport system involved in Fe-S cluster assembly fused permease/ATPase subunit
LRKIDAPVKKCAVNLFFKKKQLTIEYVRERETGTACNIDRPGQFIILFVRLCLLHSTVFCVLYTALYFVYFIAFYLVYFTAQYFIYFTALYCVYFTALYFI